MRMIAPDRFKAGNREAKEMLSQNLFRHAMDFIGEGKDIWSDDQQHGAGHHDAGEAAKEGGIARREGGDFAEDVEEEWQLRRNHAFLECFQIGGR